MKNLYTRGASVHRTGWGFRSWARVINWWFCRSTHFLHQPRGDW